MSNLKKIPKFKNEKEENLFWQKEDSTKYIDWEKAKKVKFPNLKPSTKSISIRLPISLLEDIKISANKQDIPYQSYIKMLLSKAVKK